jgi:hypothetical protein
MRHASALLLCLAPAALGALALSCVGGNDDPAAPASPPPQDVVATDAASADASLADGASGGDDGTVDAGVDVDAAPSLVDVSAPEAAAAQMIDVNQALASVAGLNADGFASRYAVAHVPSLGYDPTTAAGLDVIQASPQALSTGELDTLGKNGFVITTAHPFGSFTEGYLALYRAHLPLYVSIDSILDAVHRSYDYVLEDMESNVLGPELGTLLDAMRSRLHASTGIDPAIASDVDFYLAVAQSLLKNSIASPVAGASAADINAFVTQATAASGVQNLTLFGSLRAIDFSQFTPRGHYTDSAYLQQYFRAMMWLGLVDFRLVETQSDGSQVFHRRQFDAMLAVASLLDADNLARWQAIDAVIQAFVGEADNMTPPDVGKLLAALGAAAGSTTVPQSDADVAQAILDGGYGAQRIASQMMVEGLPHTGTLPLNRSFLVLGQRYTVDANVFANVVYDRVAGGTVKRMMPSPLDVAFAALGNDQAGVMLDPELRTYDYAPDLASMRVLVDAHGDAYWGENLYNLWLSSLRALSPTGVEGDPAGAGMPRVTGTEPWGRRILSAQLASWAQLRHDTILYAKQSYTGQAACDYPDGYIDPYPEAFAALQRFSDYAMANVVPVAGRASGGPYFQKTLTSYFTNLGQTLATLHDLAVAERTGTALSAAQLAFINTAVSTDNSNLCGYGLMVNGWYPQLVYSTRASPATFDPTIADVHTEPTDENGATVGRVLHVGTGYTRFMVVTADECSGPRAYAGLASSYYETITQNFQRLNDDQWATTLTQSPGPSDVPWVSDIVTP